MNNNIYITNYWWSNNYGAVLTAYALQCVCKCAGFSPYHIPTLDKKLHSKTLKNVPAFNKFWNDYLNIDYGVKNFETLFELNKKSNIFITGSDQVFRLENDKTLYGQYILDFADINAKKTAFSASFGVDKEQFLKETSALNLEKMKNALKSFDFISVREKSGVEICKDVFGVEAQWIIDPVFAADKSEYDKIIQNSDTDYSDKIVCYILDCDKKYREAFKYLSDKYGKKVVETANSNITIENWLASIKNCELFITDSFHGMCFALIFNKPFICVSNKSRGSSRFDSVCEMLGIENQCISDINDVYKKDCIFKINYENVNKNIEYERGRALEFFKKTVETPVASSPAKIETRYKYLENCVKELERQNNLKYQIKKFLWDNWLVIFYHLPAAVQNIIIAAKRTICRK